MHPARDLPLLAAWRLRVPARILRPLAIGDDAPVRAWLRDERARALAFARRDAHADLATLERLGARLVTPLEVDWPAGLRDLRDPPAFLAVRGTVPPDGVAIVGAREADAGACAFAYALAEGLGRPIVSGLALGIDAAAHRGALAARLPTIAYVGTGLAQTAPPEHAALAEQIIASGGALASERPPEDRATAWSLMRRDRLQAAHASTVVLVTSDLRGGAMHTLGFARQLGRARFACVSDAAGNQAALAAGAMPLSWDAAEAVSRILQG